MELQARINLMCKLGDYIVSDDADWEEAKHRAFLENPWFIIRFTNHACKQIAESFLQRQQLQQWVKHYAIDDNIESKKVGIVMAGNIPLVGFHDMLCTFISGHKCLLKLSGKDRVLFQAVYNYLLKEEPETAEHILLAENLKNCDAYIATGSNNTSRYFDYYFGKYPNIIRKNRTSVAILNGQETAEELKQLSDDIHLYFGLGCRNVTKIFVPDGYNFEALLDSFKEYLFFEDHHRYKNNYDYQLSLVLLNNIYYMTNGTTLLVENKNIFSPISILHYEYYKPGTDPLPVINEQELQCLVGNGYNDFGAVQKPSLFDYADGVDTMQFLLEI